MTISSLFLIASLTVPVSLAGDRASDSREEQFVSLKLAQAESNQESSAALVANETPVPAKPSTISECRVVIMNFSMLGLPDGQEYVAQILTDTMAAEINSTGKCDVLTQADVAQMLDFEAAKALTCADESASCIAEIGNAMGVERVINGSVGLLGSSYKVQVKLHNVAEGRVEARYDELVKGDAELLDKAARAAGRSLFNTAEETDTTSVQEPTNGAVIPQSKSEPEPAQTPDEDGITDDADEGSMLVTGLYVVGGAGIGLGTLSFLASGVVLGLAAYSVETTGDLNVIPADMKSAATPAAYVSLAGLAAGILTASIGAGIGATSLVVE
jgi:hypothetical protein